MTSGYIFSAFCIFLFIPFCPLLCIYSSIPTKHGFLFTAFSFQPRGEWRYFILSKGVLSPAQPNISLPFWQQCVSDSCTLNLVRKSGWHLFCLSAPSLPQDGRRLISNQKNMRVRRNLGIHLYWNGKVNWGGNSVKAVSCRQMKQIALVEKRAVKRRDTRSSWIHVCTWITFLSCFHHFCVMLWCT